MSRNHKKSLYTNVYFAFIYRIILVFFLYFISRVIFYIYNIHHFNDIPFNRLVTIFKGGLLFDTSAIVYTNLIFILFSVLPVPFKSHRTYQNILKYIFLISNSIGLLANFSDTPYFNFVLERTTLGVFKEFKNETNTTSLFLKFIIDFWPITIAYILSIISMIFLYNRVKVKKVTIFKPVLSYPFALIVFAGVIILVIGGARGGFKHSTRPITMSNAGKFVKAPNEMALVLNTPFCLIRSAESKSYQRVNYFNDIESQNQIYSPIHLPDSNQVKRKDNIVIFILESFNKEFIGSLNPDLDSGNYKGYTPFLDSIVKEGKSYIYSFANGRKSIEALPSILASIPSVEHPFILSPYYNNRMTTLPVLLKEMGYKSAFFHGAPNGSMGFQAFCQLAGVDEYYGKDEYNNDDDYDGIWGIWDEEFFQFFAHTMDTFTTPFLSCLFSVSSHHPFKLPEKHINSFTMNDFPLQRCVEYTDFSIKRFFETASKMSWFNNTLFIFTADHVSINQRPEFKNEMGYFSVPIILYKPGSNILGIDSISIAQQIDIMPTVLNYLGYDKPYFAFGQDLLSANSDKFAINFLNKTYRFYKGDYLLQYNGNETVHFYNFKKDNQLQFDLINTKPDMQADYEKTVKVFIQQYVNRMIDNKLYVE